MMHIQPHPRIQATIMLSFAFQPSLPFIIIFLHYLRHHHLPIHPNLHLNPTYLYQNLILQVIHVDQVVILE
jgi:hypothetical protein